jgi:hypothetical protein
MIRLAGSTWENNSTWYTKLPALLCNFYSVCLLYKCRRGPNSTTLRPAVWRPMRLKYIKLTEASDHRLTQTWRKNWSTILKEWKRMKNSWESNMRQLSSLSRNSHSAMAEQQWTWRSPQHQQRQSVTVWPSSGRTMASQSFQLPWNLVQ